MPDQTLHMLIAIDAKLDRLMGLTSALKQGMSSVEAALGQVTRGLVGTSDRLDRIDHRLDRIETRIDHILESRAA